MLLSFASRGMLNPDAALLTLDPAEGGRLRECQVTDGEPSDRDSTFAMFNRPKLLGLSKPLKQQNRVFRTQCPTSLFPFFPSAIQTQAFIPFWIMGRSLGSNLFLAHEVACTVTLCTNSLSSCERLPSALVKQNVPCCKEPREIGVILFFALVAIYFITIPPHEFGKRLRPPKID